MTTPEAGRATAVEIMRSLLEAFEGNKVSLTSVVNNLEAVIFHLGDISLEYELLEIIAAIEEYNAISLDEQRALSPSDRSTVMKLFNLLIEKTTKSSPNF